MKPVNQTIVEKGRGDCMRAVIASLFELELQQVPHFLLFGRKWFQIYHHFLWSLGYEWKGTGYPKEDELIKQITVKGFISASVPSKTLGARIIHNVIVNSKGLVVHDPNPAKHWQDINVLETGDLQSWDNIKKRKVVKL